MTARVISRCLLYTVDVGTCAASSTGGFKYINGDRRYELKYRCETAVECLLACVRDAGSKRKGNNLRTIVAVCFPEFFFRGEDGLGYYNVRTHFPIGGTPQKPNYDIRRQFASAVLTRVVNMFAAEMKRVPYKDISVVACVGTIPVGKGTPSKQVMQTPYIDWETEYPIDPTGATPFVPFTKMDNFGLFFTWDAGKPLQNYVWDKRALSGTDYTSESPYVFMGSMGPAAGMTHYGQSHFYPVHAGGSHKDPNTYYGAPTADSADVAQWITESSFSPFSFGTSICVDYAYRRQPNFTFPPDQTLCSLVFVPSAGASVSVGDIVPNGLANGAVLNADGSCASSCASNVGLFEYDRGVAASRLVVVAQRINDRSLALNAEDVFGIEDPARLFDWGYPASAPAGGAKSVRFRGYYSL